MVQARGALRAVVGAREALLTVREVAALLKVSTATVYALVDRGELDHFRVSNSIRIMSAAVERVKGPR